MVFNEDSLNKIFEDEYAKLQQNVQKPGILLVGQTGVGKSSLVNMIFGEGTAETGVGRSVTDEIKCFENEQSSVRIYDSMGYETREGGDKRFVDEVLSLVKNPAQSKINIIWYCISCLGSRITDYDLNTLKEFVNARIPVAVVLTKAEEIDDETVAQMRKVLTDSNASLPIFETSIYLPEVYHSKELIDWSIEKLPEHLQFAFISQQKASFEQKKKAVKNAIAQHVAGAGLVGASPIPFSDAPLLCANEMVLMARIMKIYGLEGIGNKLKSSALSLLLSKLGKSAVGNLLKFIPGVGSIVGGMINAGVATSITWAFGRAVAYACEKVWKAKLEGSDFAPIIENFGNIVLEAAEENWKEGRKSEDTFF